MEKQTVPRQSARCGGRSSIPPGEVRFKKPRAMEDVAVSVENEPFQRASARGPRNTSQGFTGFEPSTVEMGTSGAKDAAAAKPGGAAQVSFVCIALA